MLVNPDHTHTIEASRIRDQDALSFGQHGVVGGVPRDVETGRDPRHAQVLDHKSFQTPTQRGPRQLRTRLGCGTDVLAPHPPALDAPIAPQPHVQECGAPPQRDMRQASYYRAPDPSLAAAVVTPIIGFRRPAGEDRTFGFDALAGDFQPETVDKTETSQIRAREGSVGHVEVFQMGSVRTPIFGGPRPVQPAATPQPRTALPTPSIVKSLLCRS